ncbi:MAG: 6-carboxytetrahydropterin synthase [Desulfurococcales archaeon]|nr:6-carboxytetrahydropterin synthase [Desulfurococcales archaeon]
MNYRYCTSAVASIAMTAGKLGGTELHGHDVTVRVCVDIDRVIDIELLREITGEAVRAYDHTNLDESIGHGALIEDLLAEIRGRVIASLKSRGIEARVVTVEGSIPSGTIILLSDNGSG